MYEVAPDGFWADLTLEAALVVQVDLPDPEHPRLRVVLLVGLRLRYEPLVGGVHVVAGRDDFQVIVSQPGNLEK